MTLNNIKKMKDERGFTIVELLIVIVVIAILAAIVIVAYNGITNNARNSNYRSQATQLQKIAETVNADTGSYPTGADSTALIASFNSSTTTQLPSGLTVARVTAAPTNAAAITAADLGTASYSVEPCTGGLIIYYPVRGGAIASVNAGNPTACP